ncbi:hypothetical protein C8F04DRAFT_1271636 [Mycena alexandri]|uniref:Uncharacterized protein n=1 Tax=Mycena alexandri TaxID=1745969 RepID=A0AAD6WQA3_9AGAR|nr:hypothetical protein C8F04DRAFT_1271636 [Mycena alexandri]
MSASRFRLSATLDASNTPLDASGVPPLPNSVPPSYSTPLFAMPDYDPGPAFSAPPSVETSRPSTPPAGSYEYDLSRNYKLRWASLSTMQAWMKQECLNNSIEFVKKMLPRCPASVTAWKTTDIYVCSRQGSGGKSKYQKKEGLGTQDFVQADWVSVPPHCEDISRHATGDENLKYLRLDKETRLEIETMLRLGVEPKKILENIAQGMYHEQNLDKTRSAQAHRRDFEELWVRLPAFELRSAAGSSLPG